jgi:hypothetical protein
MFPLTLMQGNLLAVLRGYIRRGSLFVDNAAVRVGR